MKITLKWPFQAKPKPPMAAQAKGETMSTQPVTPAPTPGVSNFFNYFNKLSLVGAAVIQADKADITAKDHVVLLNDNLQGAAVAIGIFNPLWGAEAQLAYNSVVPLLDDLIGLFHHTAPAVAPASIPAS